jgi:outer membrane protein assembly factor BamB
VLGADGSILVGGDEGRLYALDPATGATRWSYGTLNALPVPPAVAGNGLIYLPSNDGNVYVLAANGQLLSKINLDGATFDVSSPAIGADGTVYIGTRGSNTLYALKEGTPIAIPTSAATSPATASAAQAAPAAVQTAQAPEGFPFVRCGSGRIYFITPNRTIGDYVINPAVLGASPILQTSATVPQALIDAVCGAGR